MTEILKRELDKTQDASDGRISAKRFIARAVVEAVVTGKWKKADGTFAPLDHDEIIDLVKWIYNHVDGPARQEMEISGPGGGPIPFTEVEIQLNRNEPVED